MPPIRKQKAEFTFPQKPTCVVVVGLKKILDDAYQHILCAIGLFNNQVLDENEITVSFSYDDSTNKLEIVMDFGGVPGYFDQVSAFPIFAEPDFSN